MCLPVDHMRPGDLQNVLLGRAWQTIDRQRCPLALWQIIEHRPICGMDPPSERKLMLYVVFHAWKIYGLPSPPRLPQTALHPFMDLIGPWHKLEAKMLVKSYSFAIVAMNAKYNKIWGLQQSLAQQIPNNLVRETRVIFFITRARQVLKGCLDR